VDVEGGNEIIDDCRIHVKLSGKLLPGQTHVSKPGRLPCKAVIHAVGPMWREGQRNDNQKNQLYAAVLQSLDEASQRSYRTIAIPAISAGIFSFPLDIAAEIILSAVRDYLTDQSGTCLKEVHVIDSNPQVMSHFEMFLKSMTLPNEPGPEEGHSESSATRRQGRTLENAAGEYQQILLRTCSMFVMLVIVVLV